jgi:hypothetical protein
VAIDAIRAAYNALGRGDVEPLVSLMDEKLEWRGRRAGTSRCLFEVRRSSTPIVGRARNPMAPRTQRAHRKPPVNAAV